MTGDRRNIEVLEKPLKSCLRSGSKTPEVNSKGGDGQRMDHGAFLM